MKIPCTYMRGGTSKGVIFQKKYLPEDTKLWKDIFLGVMGGSDPKQIDGMGGTVSSNNKIVIISPSDRDGIDVEYTIAQTVVGKPVVDFSANCGNMTSVVGPFSIDEKLVEAKEPFTKVRMYNTNSDKVIEEIVPVKNGKSVEEGDCKIAGIEGTGAELKINFLNPAGAKTGKLLPSGSPRDILNVPEIGEIEVSIVDISNCFVFIHAKDAGLTGKELPDELNGDNEKLNKIEMIRGMAGVKAGIVEKWEDAALKSAGSPKLIMLAEPQDFVDLTNVQIKKEDMDICARVMSVGKMHKASPLTAATAMGAAAFIEGSIMMDYVKNLNLTNCIRIGHPSGLMTAYVDKEGTGKNIHFNGVAAQRTARRIMDGYIYIKDKK